MLCSQNIDPINKIKKKLCFIVYYTLSCHKNQITPNRENKLNLIIIIDTTFYMEGGRLNSLLIFFFKYA